MQGLPAQDNDGRVEHGATSHCGGDRQFVAKPVKPLYYPYRCYPSATLSRRDGQPRDRLRTALWFCPSSRSVFRNWRRPSQRRLVPSPLIVACSAMRALSRSAFSSSI